MVSDLFPARIEPAASGDDSNVQEGIFRAHVVILVKGNGLHGHLTVPLQYHLWVAPC